MPDANIADAGDVTATDGNVPTAPAANNTPAQPKGPPDDLPPAEFADNATQPTAPGSTEAIPVEPPPALIHQWINTDGKPMLNGYFLQITRTGDVQIGVVDRNWSIETTEGDTQEFVGSFMSFYKDPGQPTMVRIEADLGQILNYVDFPIDAFCEDDKVYLANLEEHVRYANFYKKRLRSFTLPWDEISPADQRYVYEVVAAIQQGRYGPVAGAPAEPPIGDANPAGPPQQPLAGQSNVPAGAPPGTDPTPPVANPTAPAPVTPVTAPGPEPPSVPVSQLPPQSGNEPIKEPPAPATAPVPPSFDY